ncbi:hypothetical protein CMK14_12955 [Candidatus Poribacteria bacterium]|nr:hypothetical protein [Candidatus Poribacteria bacterium]
MIPYPLADLFQNSQSGLQAIREKGLPMCKQNWPSPRIEYLTNFSSLTICCQNMIGNTIDKIAIGTWSINGLPPEVVDCGWNRDQGLLSPC